MAGGVLVVIETVAVRDRDQFLAYQAQAREQLLERGGVVVARGGVTFEGASLTGPVLIQRWPSEQAFRDWQASEEYRPLLALRRNAADLRMTFVSEV